MSGHRWLRVALLVIITFLPTTWIACSGDPFEEARSLQSSGRHLDSLELLEQLIEERPDDPEAHFLFGSTCVATGRPSLGIWSLRRAREYEGWEVRAGNELGRAGLLSGDDPVAIEAATRVLELLGNAERRQALGSAAKEQILEGFTAQHTAAQLTALYERILAGRPVHEREAVS
jgi:hypothetical protein